jgi:hypothetical protein
MQLPFAPLRARVMLTNEHFSNAYSRVARAVVDYLPRDRSLLSFHKGDIINIINRDSTGWWKGKIGGMSRPLANRVRWCAVASPARDDSRFCFLVTDKVGQFPKDNVQVLILKPGTTGEEYIDSPRAPSLKQRLMVPIPPSFLHPAVEASVLTTFYSR